MNMKILLILMALGFLILWFLRFDKELCGKKDAPLDAETKKLIGMEPKELEPWDPFGTLAD